MTCLLHIEKSSLSSTFLFIVSSSLAFQDITSKMRCTEDRANTSNSPATWFLNDTWGIQQLADRLPISPLQKLKKNYQSLNCEATALPKISLSLSILMKTIGTLKSVALQSLGKSKLFTKKDPKRTAWIAISFATSNYQIKLQQLFFRLASIHGICNSQQQRKILRLSARPMED